MPSRKPADLFVNQLHLGYEYNEWRRRFHTRARRGRSKPSLIAAMMSKNGFGRSNPVLETTKRDEESHA